MAEVAFPMDASCQRTQTVTTKNFFFFSEVYIPIVLILILEKCKDKNIYLHIPVFHLSPLLPFYQFLLVKRKEVAEKWRQKSSKEWRTFMAFEDKRKLFQAEGKGGQENKSFSQAKFFWKIANKTEIVALYFSPLTNTICCMSKPHTIRAASLQVWKGIQHMLLVDDFNIATRGMHLKIHMFGWHQIKFH